MINPESTEYDKILQMTLWSATSNYRRYIIAGDFNHRTTDWYEMTSETGAQELMNTIKDTFLFQHVPKPTSGDTSWT